jgi:sugar diacid utilization regulator
MTAQAIQIKGGTTQQSCIDPEAEFIRLAARVAQIASQPDVTLESAQSAVADVLGPYLSRPIDMSSSMFRQALQALIQDTSAAHRARHDQYRDLLDVVADIASVDDPARLPSHVAEQARRLLHADVVYIWLSAEDGDYAYLGATSGGLTSALRDIRIPARQAMAGKIIETGLPLIASTYLDDHSFSHHHGVDQVMRDEKIIAAAGVPLGSGPRTIGALIAANRDERSYTLADIDLLRILAVHAAISIERATLSGQRNQTLASFRTDNQELQAVNRELTLRNEVAAHLHNTFARVSLTGGQISELVSEMVNIVGGQLAAFDEDGRMLAEAGGFVTTDQAEELVRAAATSLSTQTVDGLAAVPIVTATGLHGVLCLGSSEGLRQSDVHVVERAAVTAALLLLRAEAEAGAAGFRRDDFINDLVSGSDSPARLIHRAAQMKFDLRQPYTIHVVRAELQDRRLAQLANEAARTRNGLAGHCHRVQHDDRPAVVVLLPGSDARTSSLKLAESMKRAARVAVSVAGTGPCREATDVRRHFEEANSCSEAMLRIGGYALSGTLDDLGFLGLVLGNDKNIQSFVHSVLAPVIEYDAEHHTDLMRTLEALLSTDGGPTAASQSLHVHVSTVKQRMQRLQGLLGLDWRSVEKSLELRLAMKLYRVNGPLNAAASHIG